MATHPTSEAVYGIAPPQYRLPTATRLGAVELQVADLARSIAYYERVVGLRVLQRGPDRATLGPEGADAPGLVKLYERAGAATVPRRGLLGLYHFAILLPDRAALGRFVAHLGALGEYAGMSDHLVSEAVYLTDPDGLGIEVYADRPRHTWRQRDGQLVMATNPLDIESVLASAGGGTWTGAPKGTVIGHVHLYVDDLDRASAFYHDGLGLDRVVWSYPGALFLSAGGYHHHLGTNTWAVGARPAGSEDARLLAWNVVLPSDRDVEEATSSLRRAGAAVTPEGSGALVRDPWGTAVRLVAG
jgi:catechol 2,3-dioxygenase